MFKISHNFLYNYTINSFPFGITSSLSVPLQRVIWHLPSAIGDINMTPGKWGLSYVTNGSTMTCCSVHFHSCCDLLAMNVSPGTSSKHTLNEQKHKSGKPQFRYLKNWYQWHLVSIEERIYVLRFWEKDYRFAGFS